MSEQSDEFIERPFAGAELTWNCIHEYPLDARIFAKDEEVGQIKRIWQRDCFQGQLGGIDWLVRQHSGINPWYSLAFHGSETPLARTEIDFFSRVHVHVDQARKYEIRHNSSNVSTFLLEGREVVLFRRNPVLGGSSKSGAIRVEKSVYEPDIPGLIMLGLCLAFSDDLFVVPKALIP